MEKFNRLFENRTDDLEDYFSNKVLGPMGYDDLLKERDEMQELKLTDPEKSNFLNEYLGYIELAIFDFEGTI